MRKKTVRLQQGLLTGGRGARGLPVTTGDRGSRCLRVCGKARRIRFSGGKAAERGRVRDYGRDAERTSRPV